MSRISLNERGETPMEGLKLKRAIITGPTGAIGTALIEELRRAGCEVIALCRRGSPRIAALPKDEGVLVTECNVDELPSLMGRLPDCDAFYHLGWSGVYGDERRDLYRQAENVKYTLDAVRLAHSLKCKVFVGAGSQSEFGHVNGVLHPGLVCAPDNGYGAGKLAACFFSRILCDELGLRHVWSRILSVYGIRDGEYTMMMSSIRKMLRGECVDFTQGDQVWDFLYSKDAALAMRLVAERGKNGAVYVLGSGQTKTLREYMSIVRDMIDPALRLNWGAIPYYPNQVMHLEADISRLAEDTGFKPRYTFEEGMGELLEWLKK